MSILGITPRDPGTVPADQPRGREAERILAGELLQEFRHMSKTLTEFTERYAGGVVNHVLLVETVTFDAVPTPISRQFHVAAGCIEVTNPGTHTVTVSAGGASTTTPPNAGVGIYVVPAGSTRVISLNSRQVTLWGTAADTVSIQVFTAGARPGVI